MIERRVESDEPAEPGALALGELGRSPVERPASPLDLRREHPVAAPASLVPDLAVERIEGLGRPSRNVEGVGAEDGLGRPSPDDPLDPVASQAT